MAELICVLLFAGAAAFCGKRLLRYLQYFQQEEYDNARFLDWLRAKRAWDRRGTGLCAGAFIIALLFPNLAALAAAAAFGALAVAEEDPRRSGKITLKLTQRAKRILGVAAGLSFFALAILFSFAASRFSFWLGLAAVIQLQPGALMLAKRLLQFDEDARQKRFLAEAKENLARVNPFVIAITGSYGKTTTKAFLGKLLETSLGPTFWPPKSVNTPMGITRELRETLKPGHTYAVIEMGAYRQGSIARLCELTPPAAAIVTAVGVMHLERFGSAENVYAAKSELPSRVPSDGILVCNGDNPGSRRMAGEFKKAKTFLYGLDRSAGPLDAVADNVKITPEGSSFTIHWQGRSYNAFTKLHGTPALSNILASFTMAAALGADPEYLVGAVRGLEPFDNRLEVRRAGDGLQINDAYNSNPDGFLAALEVLRELPGKKKILMTPGMIELGNLQYEENKRVAAAAGKICDRVIFVGETNRAAFLEGLREAGFPEGSFLYAADRDEAFRRLAEVREAGDIVLLENDLPDLYEGDVAF